MTDISATMIDLDLTNVKENIHASGVIHLGISDHSLIYAVRKFMLPKTNPGVREIRDYKHFDAELFVEDLSRIPWNAIQQFINPNICWNVWKSFFTDTLNRHAPIQHNRTRRDSVPRIKALMRNRGYHKKRAIKYASQTHWESFKKLRNEVNIQMRNAKSIFFRDKINDCSRSNDPKKAWTLINTLLGKNNKPNNLSELLVNDNLVSDPKSMADSLNDYFVNIGLTLAAEYEEESCNVAQTTSDNINSFQCAQFKFSPIPVDNFVSTLRGLKANKTTGLDKIPPKILKLSARIVAPSLTYIFNLSLATGIYIDDWKRARVTPIFKSGDRRQCANYRPISILPVVSKVFEKEVFRQVYGYPTDNCMLSKFQSGFRPKHCTVTALIQMCDEWLENMDNGKVNGVVFLDIKKAFDSINHGILLNKMKKCFGISSIELKWFESYLFNREQQCSINEQLSSKKTITCGVPQGSILGPLLFLLYINDLPECLRSTTPCMYADDTQIFSSSYDANELVVKLNSDLARVRNWLIENKLQMHPSKSKLMFIGSSYNLKIKNTEQPVVVNNTPVSRTDTHKCLGVQIDERLELG